MPDEKDRIIEELRKEVEELRHTVEMQNNIIRDLIEQLRKNSKTVLSLRHQTDLRKSLSIRTEVCVRRAGRSRADRKVIPAHISLCFQNLIRLFLISTQIAGTVRIVSSA
jgi:hypothetical protein